MNRSIITLVAAGLAALGAAQTSPAPAGPTSPWTIATSADFYMGTSSPDTGSGATRVGRQFDTQNDKLRLAVARVQVKFADPKTGLGFTATPYLGDNADILMGADTTRNLFTKYLEEGYGTYQTKDGNTKLDVGKFYSWIGYEGADASQDDLYSRSLLYTLGQPIFHLGGRVSHTFSDKLAASVYATEGWNSTSRTTQGATYGAQIALTPNDVSSYTLGVISGNEGSYAQTTSAGLFGGIGFANPGVATVTEYDFIYTRKLGSKFSLAFNGDYASSKLATNSPGNNGTWYGGELIAKYLWSPTTTIAGRIESFGDPQGLRTGVSSTVQSAALDADFVINDQGTLRVEGRIDKSNQNLFPSNLGGMNSNNQQVTLNVAYLVHF